MTFNWMAWTVPTATFFLFIFSALVVLTLWEIKVPGGNPRKGVLRFETTRGDRLFVTLLGSAYIHLFWLGFFPDLALWWATGIAVLYGIAVFRWV